MLSYSLVLVLSEASRQSILNFRIGFLSSIGGAIAVPLFADPISDS